MAGHNELSKLYIDSLLSKKDPLKGGNGLLAPFSGKNGVSNGLISGGENKSLSLLAGLNNKQNGNDSMSQNSTKKNGGWIYGTERLSWDNSLVASYNPETKMFRCVGCDTVGFVSRIAEHYLGTHANAKVFQCPQCPYSSAWSRCVRMHLIKHHGIHNAPASLWKGQPLLDEIIHIMHNLKAKIERQGKTKFAIDHSDKRYVCPKCPYATDRRDLYARHENIHREDKPFHCYVCFKVFNRADHVKKHFLRIHRGYPYDISRIRRYPPKKLSTNMITWGKASNGTNDNGQISHSTLPLALTFPNGSTNSHNGSKSPDGEVINLTTKPAIVKTSSQSKLNIKKEPQETSSSNATSLSTNGSTDLNNKFAISTILGLLSGSGPIPPSTGKALATIKTEPEGEETEPKSKAKVFACPYCSWKGSDSWCLRRHMNTHIRPFNCSMCDYKAARAERLATHVWKVHQKLACHRCGYLATEDSDLKNHLKLVHGSNKTEKGQFSCAFCLKAFGTKSDLESHLLLSHNLSLLHCPEPGCQFCTSQITLLEAHRQHKHLTIAQIAGIGQELLNQTVCQRCGCEFADYTSLANHAQLLHGEDFEPYRCVLCGFTCLRQRLMMEHMAVHSGQLQWCRAGDGCHFYTPYQSVLREHLVRAHGVNEGCIMQCPHCGIPCSTQLSFEYHFQYHHTTNEPCNLCTTAVKRFFPNVPLGPPLNCSPSNCSPSSSSRRKQTSPQKKRTPLKSLSTLKNKSKLLKAKKIVRPNRCHISGCAISFNFRKNLVTHTLWRHSRAYACNKGCAARFPCLYKLVLHQKRCPKLDFNNK